jgi:hypothetical protein
LDARVALNRTGYSFQLGYTDVNGPQGIWTMVFKRIKKKLIDIGFLVGFPDYGFEFNGNGFLSDIGLIDLVSINF